MTETETELKSKYPACTGCKYLQQDVEYLKACSHPRSYKFMKTSYDYVRGTKTVELTYAFNMRLIPWIFGGCGKKARLRKTG